MTLSSTFKHYVNNNYTIATEYTYFQSIVYNLSFKSLTLPFWSHQTIPTKSLNFDRNKDLNIVNKMVYNLSTISKKRIEIQAANITLT